MRHVVVMWRSSECDLYCVSTQIRQVAAVDEVRQHEVDQPVGAAERHGRLGPVRGQRQQPLALAAGEHDREVDDWIFQGLLDVEHLPEAEGAAP